MRRAIIIFLFALSSCSFTYSPVKDFSQPTKIVASYYGGTDGFDGKPSASGEVFDSTDLTAAHQTLPFGTLLRLRNPKNGRAVTVRITDRGPFIYGRDLDISRQAAWELGMLTDGVAELIAEHSGRLP